MSKRKRVLTVVSIIGAVGGVFYGGARYFYSREIGKSDGSEYGIVNTVWRQVKH